ncbi:transcription-repair coupling factor [Cutibacterium acnes JCM 18920]|nr:transcription-repair coupling factor [Cutibacterium acnes JCM 18920]
MLVAFGGLTSLLSREPVLSHVVEDALTRRTPTLDLQVAASARPAVAAVLGRSFDGSGRLPVLLVTSTFREAEESVATLKTWLGADSVCYYPSWETLPHERLSPRTDTVGRRMEVLRRLCGTEGEVPQVVVAPVRSLLQPQVAGLGRIARCAWQWENSMTLPSSRLNSSTPHIAGLTWWNAVANSQYVAVSSTSSRRC